MQTPHARFQRALPSDAMEDAFHFTPQIIPKYSPRPQVGNDSKFANELEISIDSPLSEIAEQTGFCNAAYLASRIHPTRNQPQEIWECVIKSRPLMPRCYSMQCGWLESGRDSGYSPEVRFVNMPNIANHKVVEFDHFERGGVES